MRIWIIDHYSVPVEYYPLARNTNFAKYLIKKGHDVRIFAASTVHNSAENLTEKGKKYIEINDGGVKYVLVKCHPYSGNGLKRVLNMYEFAQKLESVCEHYPKPDAILSTSMTLFACRKGIQLGQKYGCKKIAQITDLWPETLVAYGRAGRRHPAVLYFRAIEKWLYKHADRIVFSMEGAYDYIIEQGWEKEIPRSKVHYINNGVDLEQFDSNKKEYQISDEDLENDEIIKAVYVGSIRYANNVGALLDIAKKVKSSVRFLIWGDGDEVGYLKERTRREHINNVVFKGKVDKKYIPYIVTKADVNMMDMQETNTLFRFGISPNKLFDYFAAKKPFVMYQLHDYNPAIEYNVGMVADDYSEIISYLNDFNDLKKKQEDDLKYERARQAFSYERLTNELIKIIESA